MLDRLCDRRSSIVLVLIGLTLIVYFPVKDYQFIGYDDSRYVTRNTHYRGWIELEQHCLGLHDL